MITVDDIVEAKRKYIIDHVMPADLSSDVKEGLAIKEEMIAKVTAESVRELSPDIDQTIELLNQSGVSKEKYSKFINGEITQVELYEKPDPVSTSVKYCVDQKELMTYRENTKIELKVPETPNQDGKKSISIWFLIKLAGELHDMYRSKNTYWSIIPKDSTPPDVPDFVQIRFRGVIPGRISTKTFENGLEAMPTFDDISTVNVINNNYTYTDLIDLSSKLVIDKVLNSEDIYKLTLWSTVLGFIPEMQSEVPNYTKTVNLTDGDIYNFSPLLSSTNQSELTRNSQEMRCYLFYNNDWIELPKGLRVLSTTDNYSFLTTKKIEFDENDSGTRTVSSNGIVPLRSESGNTTESSTGGLYCLTDQLVNTKYEDVESDVFMYMHVTVPNPEKQQEQKQKCCSKSGNCSKSSSSCDKGQTDTAIKHEPCVNKPWFNNMMDHILHNQLDPTLAAIIKLCEGMLKIKGAPDSNGDTLSDTGYGDDAEDALKIVLGISPRDVEVDAACSLIMDAAESAVNSAIDSAISDFNNMIDNSMNNAISAAMNSVSSSRKLKANTDGEDPELKAIAKANQSALVETTKMMTDFSQTMCDARMMDNGDASSLEKVLSSIELAKQKAAQEAEIQAAKIAAQYIKDCTS